MSFLKNEDSDLLLAVAGIGASFLLGRKKGYKEGYTIGYNDGDGSASEKYAARLERTKARIEREYEEKMKELEGKK